VRLTPVEQQVRLGFVVVRDRQRRILAGPEALAFLANKVVEWGPAEPDRSSGAVVTNPFSRALVSGSRSVTPGHRFPDRPASLRMGRRQRVPHESIIPSGYSGRVVFPDWVEDITDSAVRKGSPGVQRMGGDDGHGTGR